MYKLGEKMYTTALNKNYRYFTSALNTSFWITLNFDFTTP